jgi:hypothetical protein
MRVLRRDPQSSRGTSLDSLSRSRGPAALLAIVASVAAAGCSTQTREEDFAEETCATILPPARQMLEIRAGVADTPAEPVDRARAEMLQFALRAQALTRELTLSLRRRGGPDTKAERRADDYINSFARFADETTVAALRRVRRLRDDMSVARTTRALEVLKTDLLVAFVQMTDGVAAINTQVPQLRELFQSADSCATLRDLDNG